MNNRNKSIQEKLNILFNQWDPLGVLPFKGGPKDEYECLVIPVLSLLQQHCLKTEIIHYLDKRLKEHMGLNLPSKEVKCFIEKVFKWWNYGILYNSKSNDLFINNPKNPTVFQPKDQLNYLKDAIQKDIMKGGKVK